MTKVHISFLGTDVPNKIKGLETNFLNNSLAMRSQEWNTIIVLWRGVFCSIRDNTDTVALA